MATDKQRVRFFRLWASARAEVCEGFGLCCRVSTDEREARHRWIRRHTGDRTDNINAVRPGAEFSRLMLQTALAAGDYREAAYWELDAAKRWTFFMRNLVRQLGEITRTPHPWGYVQSIFAHLRLPADWQDIPEAELDHVWQMLDTHRRRLLKQEHGWKGLRRSDRDPLGFFPEAQYFYGACGEPDRLGIKWPEAAPQAPQPARHEPAVAAPAPQAREAVCV